MRTAVRHVAIRIDHDRGEVGRRRVLVRVGDARHVGSVTPARVDRTRVMPGRPRALTFARGLQWTHELHLREIVGARAREFTPGTAVRGRIDDDGTAGPREHAGDDDERAVDGVALRRVVRGRRRERAMAPVSVGEPASTRASRWYRPSRCRR